MKKDDANTWQQLFPDEKQKQQWDRLVLNDKAGTIYQLSWYLDVVTGGKWFLITNGRLDAGMPFAFKKRTGYRNLYQPFYTMFFNALGEASAESLVNHAGDNFHHVYLTTESPVGHMPHRQRTRQELDLENFSPSVYSENAVRQIKKAEKQSLLFEFHAQAREVVDLFAGNRGATLKEYKTADFRTLEQLIRVSLEKKHGFCARVREHDTVLASAFFLTFRNRVIFLKGGVNNAGKQKGAMYWLMHQVLLWSKEQYGIFDFGGSNDKNVAGFYKRLGGQDLVYNSIETDKRNLLHKFVGKIRK